MMNSKIRFSGYIGIVILAIGLTACGGGGSGVSIGDVTGGGTGGTTFDRISGSTGGGGTGGTTGSSSQSSDTDNSGDTGGNTGGDTADTTGSSSQSSDTDNSGDTNTGTLSQQGAPLRTLADAIRSAIEAASRSGAAPDGAPAVIAIERGVTGNPEIEITSNDANARETVCQGDRCYSSSTSSDDYASYQKAGSAPVAPTTTRYSGYKLTRSRGMPESAYVYTDIERTSAQDFTDVWTLDTDTDSDSVNDALRIVAAHLTDRLVTHIARNPDDMREDDETSVNPVDRGVLGEDRTFDRGHEISGHFDGAYGIYSCVAASCTLNLAMPPTGITAMTGWVFMPRSYTGAGGGTREPQVDVADSDYRWFGFWLRGPNPDEDNGFGITTFSGGSEVFSGSFTALTGRATYEGPAAGQYVKDADAGLFTAKVTLHADFGATQTIHGGLGDFRGNGRNLGWDLIFEETPLGGHGSFSGRTHGTTRVVGTNFSRDEGQDNHGGYAGRLYGNNPDGSAPAGVSGTFHGKFDDGAVVGAFGTSLYIRTR